MKRFGLALLITMGIFVLFFGVFWVKDKCSVNMKRINLKHYYVRNHSVDTGDGFLKGKVADEYSSTLRNMDNIEEVEHSLGEDKSYEEELLFEFDDHLMFYETVYFDFHSKKFFSADNYTEVMEELRNVALENKEYF